MTRAHLIRPRPKTELVPADMALMSVGTAHLQMDMAHPLTDWMQLPMDKAHPLMDRVHLPTDRTHLPVDIATNTAHSAMTMIVLSAAPGQMQ